MKTLLIELIRIVAPPVVILAGGVGGYFALGSGRTVPVREVDENRAPLVETVPVADHEDGFDIEVDGLVVPYRDIELSAEVAGRITHKAEDCRAGHFVSKGTVLVEIDPRDYELQVEQLAKERDQAAVEIEEMEVEIANTETLVKLADENLSLQRSELRRLEELAGTRVVSESELDQGRRDELTARNALQTEQNKLRLLRTRLTRLERARELVESQLKRARLDLDRTRISAPIDGVIVEDSVEQNAYVQTGTSLLVIEDTSSVEVKCSLRMEELDWVWRQEGGGLPEARSRIPYLAYELPKTPATVTYELAGRKYDWNAALARYDGIGLDERTRTAPCRVVVDDPRGVIAQDPLGPPGPSALVRGMFVTVAIHVKPPKTFLRLPERAVRPGNKVWRVDDGRLHIEGVHVVRVSDAGVLIDAKQSRLSIGDRIVVSPLAVVGSGMAVEEQQSE